MDCDYDPGGAMRFYARCYIARLTLAEAAAFAREHCKKTGDDDERSNEVKESEAVEDAAPLFADVP